MCDGLELLMARGGGGVLFAPHYACTKAILQHSMAGDPCTHGQKENMTKDEHINLLHGAL